MPLTAAEITEPFGEGSKSFVPLGMDKSEPGDRL